MLAVVVSLLGYDSDVTSSLSKHDSVHIRKEVHFIVPWAIHEIPSVLATHIFHDSNDLKESLLSKVLHRLTRHLRDSMDV